MERQKHMKGYSVVIARMLVCAGLVTFGVLTHPAPAGAEDPIRQIALSETLVGRFVAALPEMNAAAITSPQSANASDAKLRAAAEAIAKKHGFQSFQHFSDVSSSIALVLIGIDPATKRFTEPKVTIERQIAELTKTLAELKESLEAAQRTTDRRNVEVVQKYHELISKAATSRQ